MKVDGEGGLLSEAEAGEERLSTFLCLRSESQLKWAGFIYTWI